MNDKLLVEVELIDHLKRSTSYHGDRGMLSESSNSMISSNSSAAILLSSFSNTSEASSNTVLRKSHSTVGDYCSLDSTIETPDQDVEYDMDHDSSGNRRPFTAAASLSSKFHSMTTTAKKKKLPVKKLVVPLVESRSNDRPRSADLNGWGDFDTDRLLQEDFEGSTNLLNEESEDALVLALRAGTTLEESHREYMRPKSRIRHSAPAASTHNAIDDFPSALEATDSARYKPVKEQQRPVTHVVRQRPLTVVDFDSVQALKIKAKQVLRLNIVQFQSHLPTGDSPPPTPTTQQKRLPKLQLGSDPVPLPLFGSSLPDSFEMRAIIFERFRYLWSLMSTSAYVAAGSVSDDAQAKSPFECSMTLIKICKTVGISLSTNTSSSSLSFWNSKQRDIDFESFCDFAIRNAIQPALQHFKMDKTVNEYVAMIDRIVENMITSSSSTPQLERTASGTGEEECRTKELAEIHPLLPHWKIGITFLGKQKPVARPGVNATIADPTLESQSENTKRVVVAANLPRHREFAFPMPGNEAKAIHDANIQRKVQLHKSWQPHSVLANTSLNIVSLQAVSEFPPFVSTPAVAERPMHTNSDSGRPIPTVLLGSQRSDAVAKYENQKCEAVISDTAGNNNHVVQNDKTFAASQRAEAPCADEEVLLCVECSQAEAVLWCASCFAVFCVHCWQTSHLLNVDMSSIAEGSDCSISMLAPMAKPLRANGTMNNQYVPVAMHYLATKPQATGKLARGACSGDWKHQREEPVGVSRLDTLGTQHELPAVVSHAILPPLHKTSKPATKDEHHPEYLESTSNLVKSLMLGVTPLSSSSLSNHNSSLSPVPNIAPRGKYKDPLGKRPKLHPAAVFLDPNELFRDS